MLAAHFEILELLVAHLKELKDSEKTQVINDYSTITPAVLQCPGIYKIIQLLHYLVGQPLNLYDCLCHPGYFSDLTFVFAHEANCCIFWWPCELSLNSEAKQFVLYTSQCHMTSAAPWIFWKIYCKYMDSQLQQKCSFCIQNKLASHLSLCFPLRVQGLGPLRKLLLSLWNPRDIHRKIWCGMGSSSSVGYFKAWATNCSGGDQQGSPNSFHTTLIKRLSLAPSQLCQAVLVCHCFHIFFEPLSFIFYLLCLFLLSWTLNLWLLMHVYLSIVPCREPKQIRRPTMADLWSSDVSITRIVTPWHLSSYFQNTFAYLTHHNSVKSEGQDSHLQMREYKLREINHFFMFPWQVSGRSPISSTLS